MNLRIAAVLAAISQALQLEAHQSANEILAKKYFADNDANGDGILSWGELVDTNIDMWYADTDTEFDM
jgi:hypothetical protein